MVVGGGEGEVLEIAIRGGGGGVVVVGGGGKGEEWWVMTCEMRGWLMMASGDG